jgi:hypothetical protein
MDAEQTSHSTVVPAKAGTHNHRVKLLRESRPPARFNHDGRGVWVPAFAGTTPNYTTVLCRSMQTRKTSSIGLPHQSLEKISISE